LCERRENLYCIHCGHFLNKNAKFCTYCGEPVPEDLQRKYNVDSNKKQETTDGPETLLNETTPMMEKGKKEVSSSTEKETTFEVEDTDEKLGSNSLEQEDKMTSEQKANVALNNQNTDMAASIAPSGYSEVPEHAFHESDIQMNERYHKEKNFTEREPVSTKGFSDHVKNSFNHATGRINTLVGEEGEVRLNLKDIFSNVFKKHSKEEAELIFISGTSFTTPKESEIPVTWPKPWLFSRVFLTLALTFFLLFIANDIFQNFFALPGLIVIGSFAVPFSLLIFFWEMNAPQNISLYEIAVMFFVGGAASFPATLILHSIFPVYDITFFGAIVIGVVEEIGKLAIIIYFINKLNPKYILNGLLIGAAIGAGFAAFESTGYAFAADFLGSQSMISVTLLRAWTGIGTHTIWSAIAGAALVLVKGDYEITINQIFSWPFLRLFIVSMALHAAWDMPIFIHENFYLQYIILIFIGWIFIFVLISAGLRQIDRLNTERSPDNLRNE